MESAVILSITLRYWKETGVILKRRIPGLLKQRAYRPRCLPTLEGSLPQSSAVATGRAGAPRDGIRVKSEIQSTQDGPILIMRVGHKPES